ncbi:MAG TPA: molybdopterin-dependent oxidoreductase, partial [Candidatus Dormibacteraeota bacterium]|nr:molybdopterin-dependent oxidoreductase [Candidatus Dormibacteraeota bacterium]
RVTYDDVIAFTADALKESGRQVAGWASPAASNEELFLFQRLFREVLGSANIDHRGGVLEDAEPDDMTLPIADIERCDHVVVLGGQDVIDAAPVLHLRLFKSQRKGLQVTKVGAAEVKKALDAVPAEALAVGILATEANKTAAAELHGKLQKKLKGSVRRLIVTSGPNGRGAKDLGILPHRGPGYVSLNGTAGKGRVEWPGAGVKALYVHESSPLNGFVPTDAESMWLSALPLVVFHRFKPSRLDEVAHVIIPGHAFTEKDGTVTNMEGRVQRILKGIDAAWVREDWRVLQGIANHLGASWEYESVENITADLVRALPPYAAVNQGARVLWSEQR